ncbi:MAG: serine/threonine-protein phosphatase [Erysipelotrichia bacterium]|nr:serine/threonine-protein phosphatase [Erysipelotrichia bacterium]
MSDKTKLKKNSGELFFYLFWLLSIAIMAVLSRSSDLALFAVFIMMVIFLVLVKGRLAEQRMLRDVCSFYERAHQLDDLQLLHSDRPYARILDTVIDLGDFDWAVLFLMDYEQDRFVAVESSGINLEKFSSVSFDEVTTEQSIDSMALSFKLLEHAFKTHEFRGALAGTALAHGDVYYGCLLVGRHETDKELSSEDSFRLDILSDQISLCLHNYRMHKELAFRAEELAGRQIQLQRELEMARIVQDGAMPRYLPELAGIKIASYLKPARFIGGDFLRYVADSSGDCLGILIGDVCGKGIPAALVMAVVVCLFKEKTDLTVDPAVLMRSVNISLKEFLGAGSRFNSTALWGVLNLQDMNFCYASAGHDFPLLFSARTGKLTELESTGTLLGIFSESDYSSCNVPVENGDKILFYSDGLPDFFEVLHGCEDGYLYLKEFFASRAEKTSEEIVDEISSMVENSTAGLKDDITVAVFSIDKTGKGTILSSTKDN